MAGTRRLLAVLAGLAIVAGACTGDSGPDGAPPESPLPPIEVAEQPIVSVVDAVRPAVVNVRTNLASEQSLAGPPGQGSGTGFIIEGDGVVVTNFHVVEGALSIDVFTADGDRFEARAIGADPNADLAVLKIDAQDLPTVQLGDSDSLALGQVVVAMGFALALEGGPSVTSGIVSAKGRTIQTTSPATGEPRTLEELIQTDAAINPGNSGGPLLDLAGRVVGINTAAAGMAENIGFAIAIDRARPIIEEALQDPAAPAPYMGVSTIDVDPLVQSQFGLAVDAGALVADVAPGGPAERGGIMPGDVIVEMEGVRIESGEDVRAVILDHEPDDEIDVVVNRGGQELSTSITLGARPLPASGG